MFLPEFGTTETMIFVIDNYDSFTYKDQVLIDALIPDLGLKFKYGVYVREAVLVLTFAILMSVCAQIAIRLPGTVVPITGQTFGVLLTGGALGARRGVLSMLLYSLMGMFLFPVFAPNSAVIKESLGESGVFHFVFKLQIEPQGARNVHF